MFNALKSNAMDLLKHSFKDSALLFNIFNALNISLIFHAFSIHLIFLAILWYCDNCNNVINHRKLQLISTPF